MPLRRVYLYLGIAVVAVVLGITAREITKTNDTIVVRDVRIENSQSGTPLIGGSFSLTDHNGRTVTDKDLRGRHLLIFFGYTYCPDICPTNLSTMTTALEMLGARAQQIQPAFVTIDPERDNPEQLKMYVSHFHPKLLGLTGTPAQIKQVAQVYRIHAAKADEDPQDAENYLMDHTSLTYLMGPDGKYKTFFRHGMTAEAMAEKLKTALAATPAAKITSTD